MDQIVIINNHDYVEKLHPPTYKNRTGDRRGARNSIQEISKSEEKKREYINVQDAKGKE